MKCHQYIINSYLYILFSFIILSADAQETNSQVTGKIITEKTEILSGATVTAIHEPTKNTFVTQSRSDGFFHFFNLKPGGPYSITVTSVGYETVKKENVFVNLNSSDHFFNLSNNEAIDFILREKNTTLQEVIVKKLVANKTGIETDINNQKLISLPSISRNLQDYIRMVPQALVNADGSFSLAGQSPRFNAFFIDGANNNDIQGQTQTGTNGGLTGSAPISLDAIEEIKILLAPYNVQYSNFTGGSVNAITRSGSNEVNASVWYYFRNENLAGRSPVPNEIPGNTGVFERPRLSHFFNQTAGVRIGGPVFKNKLFYFLLAEKQSETRPQVFNISEYRGSSNLQQLNALYNRLQNFYHYDPGSFTESIDELNTTKFMGKVDWNPSLKNKFTLTWRYNIAERIAASTGSSTAINFSNNIFRLPTQTHSATFEWKSFHTHAISNRLLATVTHQSDDRQWKGQPFPRVIINDGSAIVRFGSGPSTMLSLFKAIEFSMSNILRFVKNRHTLSAGIELNHSRINDTGIQNFFGSYTFRSVNDFMNGIAPVRLQRSFSLLDEPKGDNTLAAAKYKTIRLGAFFNDDINVSSKLQLNAGIRIDRNSVPANTYEDKYFNDTAASVISQYYDLEGAKAGFAMLPAFQISPRAGFTYRMSKALIFRGGAGIFTGHIVNVWNSLLQQNNGVSVGSYSIIPQQYGLTFNPDPYNQPTPQSLQIDPSVAKGELDIISKKFKYPSVFRTSLSVTKKINNWTFSLEGIITKNIRETKYTNVSIMPPIDTTDLPDQRSVYSFGLTPGKIILPRLINPYTQIFLLSNNHGKKGSSYSLAFTIEKHYKKWDLSSGYVFGKSKALFETSSGVSGYANQWMQTETVNGRNNTILSRSDVDPGHRVFFNLNRKFTYAKDKLASTISLFYDGRSGHPYSYVYGGSIVNDNGTLESYDLIYIPTVNDLSNMTFTDIINSSSQVLYSGQQQKDLLNSFIDHDKYLKDQRGQFAERNGARLPYTHIIDMRIQQDFKIKINRKETVISVLFDIFNLTNMLNKNWGRIYFLSDDKFPLIQFAGYTGSQPPTPKYQFKPLTGTSYSIETGTMPGGSARWISQLGFRINFN
jgi:hypothetical protein